MPAPEFLYLVVESSYGVPKATPVLGTDALYTRLDGGNAFTARSRPIQKKIMYGGGRATPALTVSGQSEVKGKLTTLLYPSQQAIFLNWWLGLVNAGQTLPWPTTEPAGDLPSCSVYHAIQRADGTYRRRRYAGVKVAGGTLSSSGESQLWKLDLDLVGQKPVGNSFDSSTDPDDTEFPDPAEADYPTNPYLFIHSTGGLTVGGARTAFSSLSLKVTNAIDPRFFESRYLQLCRWRGRTTTLDAQLLLKATPDDRSAFEALTAQTASLKIDNGTKHATIALQGSNYFDADEDELPLDKVFESKLTLANYWDGTAGTDLALTLA